MSRANSFRKTLLYTPKLQSALGRLDALVDWERFHHDSLSGSKRRSRISTAPARILLSRLGNPHRILSAIHITGSKGKGSVAAILTAALLRAPFLCTAVGTYGSPHVERVNERIRINGREIPDDDLANALNFAMEAREKHPLLENATWFDVVTTAAFWAFRRSQATWAVVEVGMGGRLDSTNVLSAPVAVITNLHLEHAQIIGPTLRDIAYEKAGIIAPGADVICGLEENHPFAHIFEKEARSKSPNARITFCPKGDNSIMQHNLKLSRGAMKAVANRLGVHGLSDEELVPMEIAGKALSALPARQEMFHVSGGENGQEVRVLLDGAHVPESVSLVLGEIQFTAPPVVVLGIAKDKEAHGISEAIHSSDPEKIFATTPGKGERYLEASLLAEVLRETGKTPVVVVEEASKALYRAISCASNLRTDVVIVGSLHLAGLLRPKLRRLQDTRKSKIHVGGRSALEL